MHRLGCAWVFGPNLFSTLILAGEQILLEDLFLAILAVKVRVLISL